MASPHLPYGAGQQLIDEQLADPVDRARQVKAEQVAKEQQIGLDDALCLVALATEKLELDRGGNTGLSGEDLDAELARLQDVFDRELAAAKERERRRRS